MRQRSTLILNILAAGLLWLLGQSFLLVPPAMLPLTGSLAAWMHPLLGGLCIVIALATGFALFASARMRQSAELQLLILATLGILAALFMQHRLFIEGLLIVGTLAANIGGLAKPIGDGQQEDRRPLAAVILTTAIIGLLLVLNLPPIWTDPYPALAGFRRPLGVVFILSAVLAAVPLIRRGMKSLWRWERALALPWLAWLLILIPTLRLPHILPPAVLVVVILLAEPVPWEQFILPEADRVGKRLVWVEALTLLVMAGLLAILLGIIDQSFATAGMAGAGLFIRKWVFVTFTLITALGIYGTAMIALTINGLMTSQSGELTTQNLWSRRVARYVKPFSQTREGLQARLDAQTDQLDALSGQVIVERRKSQQLTLLTELSQQLEAQLDHPVAAQLTVNSLASAIEQCYVSLYMYDPDHQQYTALATGGWTRSKPASGSEQDHLKIILDRVIRLRKSQIIIDLRLDPALVKEQEEPARLPLSFIAVPLSYTGNIKGVICVESETANAFGSGDLVLTESMAAELVRAWERSSYHRRLMELIQAGISLSTMVEPESTVKEIASIARQTLEARFTYASAVFDPEEDVSHQAESGNAPRLLKSLTVGSGLGALLTASAHAVQPFRVRDVRKYASRTRLDLDHNGLRSLLVIPIRLHNRNIGSILAFGKERETVFTENDESLASLIASQAAATIESVWLQQELRTTLRTTRLLYELSYQIIQAEGLSAAAGHIAEVAQRLTHADSTGIVLFTPEGQVQTRLEVDAAGIHPSPGHPMQMVEKVMSSGRVIYEDRDRSATRVCLPIQTPMRKYGAMWLTLSDRRGKRTGSPADLQTLANQAALALERALLLVESRQRAEDLKHAYIELELGYDRTLTGLISALDARDKETEGHSTRVSLLTTRLGVALGLNAQLLKALERGALLHDIGKIGVSDSILNKPGPLSEVEWPQMRRHPAIGARIIEDIPFLEEALPVIRSHHERWDGSGYPEGLRGKHIPRLARIFAVVDVFDALTSDRPYRERLSTTAALEYLNNHAGILFDPQVVMEFDHLVSENTTDLITTD